MSRRVKILKVSQEALVALFSLDGTKLVKIEGMPKDAKIVGSSGELFFDQDIIAFKVESEEFPEVPNGKLIPTLELTVHDLSAKQRGREFI